MKFVTIRPVFLSYKSKRKSFVFDEANKAKCVEYGKGLQISGIKFVVEISTDDGGTRFIAGKTWLESHGFSALPLDN